MASTSKTNIPIVFGVMTIGNGEEQSRVRDLPTAGSLLDIFASYGHNEIDTARGYGSGTSEEYLGKLKWQDRNLILATKCAPNSVSTVPGQQWKHTPESLRACLQTSLKALNATSVDLFYLHHPDRGTPYLDTVRALDAMHKEGLFRRWGLSNYMSWEVAQICELCRANGLVLPEVYQGVYNALHRGVEPELFPCLREYGLAFYSFNPLAGGLLTNAIKGIQAPVEAGSRFDPNKKQGKRYRDRYWKEEYFEAIEGLKEVCEKKGLTLGEVALRWCMWHSMLDGNKGDKVIIGASGEKHLKENLADFEKGPLDSEVLESLDRAWRDVKGVVANYYH